MAIHVQALDKEIGVVETCHGITLMIVLHVLMEVPAVFLLETSRTRRHRIHIISRGYADVVLIEVIQVSAGIHEPFRIAKHGDLYLGARHRHAVELGKSDVQLL